MYKVFKYTQNRILTTNVFACCCCWWLDADAVACFVLTDNGAASGTIDPGGGLFGKRNNNFWLPRPAPWK